MSVVSAGKWWESREGRFQNVFDNTVVEHYKVETDNANDGPLTISSYFATSHIPQIIFNSPHPENSSYTARSLDCTPLAPKGWEVRVTYSTQPFQTEEDEDPNPLNRATRISGSAEFYQEFTNQDKDGKVMVTDAGYPMEPIERDRVGWIINFRKNVLTIPSWLLSHPNKVNASAFTILGLTVPARVAKFQAPYFSEENVENDVVYREVGGSISLREETWDVDRLNAGFYDKDGKRILDEDGVDTVEPWPLTSAGVRLDVKSLHASGGVDAVRDAIIFKTYELYFTANFSVLPL